MHDLTGEGELRALLLKSGASFDTVVLDSTYETDGRLTGLAMKRRSARLPGSKIIRSKPRGLNEAEGVPGGLQLNGDWRVWWRRPSCWRDDFAYPAGGTVINIVCGNDTNFYMPALDTLHTTRRPSQRMDRLRSFFRGAQPDLGTSADRLRSMPLFSESFGMIGWALDVIGNRTHCDRDGLLIRARWAGEGRRPAVWRFVDEYHLLVDIERGVLLSLAGIVDGQQAVVMSVRSIEFDTVIPDTVFAFEPPAGTRIVWHRGSAG